MPLTKYLGVFLSGLQKKIFLKISKFLDFIFNGRLLIEISDTMLEISPSSKEVIEISKKLKDIGILEKISKNKRDHDEPFLYHYSCQAKNKAFGLGSHFFDESSALWSAVGESVERRIWYASRKYFKKIKTATHKEIMEQALDVFSLAGFSEEQKREISVLRFDTNTPFSWIETRSLISGKKIYCPAQLVALQYFIENVKTTKNSPKKEPFLRWPITTGTAIGKTFEEACVKGILETLERDAFMIYYTNKLSPSVLDIKHLSEQDTDLKKIFSHLKKYHLEPFLLYLKTDFSVHIVCAAVVDLTDLGPKVTIGASADFNLKNCIIHALSESQLVRFHNKSKFSEEIPIDKSLFEKRDRVIYWSRPENFSKLEFFLKGEKIKARIEDFQLPQKPKEKLTYYRKKLDCLLDQLEKKGYEAVSCDLTPRKIKKIGLHCVQTIIPELQPLHLEEAIPYLGGKRLKEIPAMLGYEAAKEPNREPHPFS